MSVAAMLSIGKLFVGVCMVLIVTTAAMKVSPPPTTHSLQNANRELPDFNEINAELYQGVLDSRRKIKCRDNDIIIITYPKVANCTRVLYCRLSVYRIRPH